MTSSNNLSRQPSYMSSGIVLVAMSVLLIGGGLLIWNSRQPESGPPVVAELNPDVVTAPTLALRPLPSPTPPSEVQPTLHGITYGVENGTAIVKIKVVADGDELIVDASTGRLIESRPARPSAPPPLGKFAAPFVPMM